MYDDKLIIFVDDDSDITTLYSAVFSNSGFKYLIARSGAEAKTLLQTQKPYLLLLDIMLPDTSGLDILKEIKSNPATKDITVWMLSNLGDVDTQTKAKDLGATEYIVKAQYTPNQVIEKIKAFLG